MAYFANGTEGEIFDQQCGKCKYGAKACSIAYVQIHYNYDACNNKIASEILNALVNENGTCTMWKQFRQDFEIDPNQLDLFK